MTNVKNRVILEDTVLCLKERRLQEFSAVWIPAQYIMKMVFLTALGVGGATIFGSLIGFLFKHISHRFSDIVLSFAAGVMLSAPVL